MNQISGRLVTLNIVVAVVLVASPALSMVYMWRDAAGITHYTNKEYDIPASYKARAKALYPEATDSGQNQLQGGNGQANPNPVVVVQPPVKQQPRPVHVEPPKAPSVVTPVATPAVTAPQSNTPRSQPRRRVPRPPRDRSADDE